MAENFQETRWKINLIRNIFLTIFTKIWNE